MMMLVAKVCFLLVSTALVQGIPNPSKKAPKEASSTKTCNCVCGMNNRQMRVVGGNETKMHEFPWIAGLSRNGEFYCSASLITRKHILTAAHCVNGFDARGITIVLADHDRNSANRFSTTIIRAAKKIRQHRAFDAHSFNNDIAVIEMDESVTFNDKVQTVCLPNAENPNYAGRLGIVAGWGRTAENRKMSTVLRKAAVPVWTKKDCYNSGYGERRISENMFCAGYPDGDKDACQGDSGGPLQINSNGGSMEVIGLVSWGRGCGRPNLPGIYTKVSNYVDWIEESINDECLCPHPKLNPRRA